VRQHIPHKYAPRPIIDFRNQDRSRRVLRLLFWGRLEKKLLSFVLDIQYSIINFAIFDLGSWVSAEVEMVFRPTEMSSAGNL
jgi:hypothetical protein